MTGAGGWAAAAANFAATHVLLAVDDAIWATSATATQRSAADRRRAHEHACKRLIETDSPGAAWRCLKTHLGRSP
jgi:hypothetical protein